MRARSAVSGCCRGMAGRVPGTPGFGKFRIRTYFLDASRIRDYDVSTESEATMTATATPRRIPTGSPTLYEIVLQHPDGRRLLVGYSGSASGNLRAFLALLAQNDQKIGLAVVRTTGSETFDLVNPRRRADGFRIGDWTARWSGRTQRDAVLSPLPWVADDHALAGSSADHSS